MAAVLNGKRRATLPISLEDVLAIAVFNDARDNLNCHHYIQNVSYQRGP